jgi:hypothetical protein
MRMNLDYYWDRERQVDESLGDYDPQTAACRRLWTAVLRSAVYDLERGTFDDFPGMTDRDEIVVYYYRAFVWFTSRHPEFRRTFNQVCEYIDLDPKEVLRALDERGLLERGRNRPLPIAKRL